MQKDTEGSHLSSPGAVSFSQGTETWHRKDAFVCQRIHTLLNDRGLTFISLLSTIVFVNGEARFEASHGPSWNILSIPLFLFLHTSVDFSVLFSTKPAWCTAKKILSVCYLPSWSLMAVSYLVDSASAEHGTLEEEEESQRYVYFLPHYASTPR